MSDFASMRPLRKVEASRTLAVHFRRTFGRQINIFALNEHPTSEHGAVVFQERVDAIPRPLRINVPSGADIFDPRVF